MFIFAFVGTDTEGYYINNNGRKSHSYNAPESLRTALNGVNSSEVLSLSGGPHGKYLLQARGNYSDSRGVADGVHIRDVVFYTFGGRNVWFAHLTKHTKWSNLENSLKLRIDAVGASNIRSLSMGVNDSWAMVYMAESHNLSWSTRGTPSTLHNELRSESVHDVKNIVLSPFDANHWWIEYGNGQTSYDLPRAWYEDIERIRHHSN
ncbi:hypothetical protein HYDPIDRAFT_118851 [Hydnomerulius pinastri MD-312]|uniref:Uncharacterized protein n=1 Tax=Hydnomerulius pinastri MD-312 TaxID=994086 RepID=A0A0C9W8Q4_9AGAM|nr:hypothetical protein HYDPIDRAFT_118851 [Hydnomerulius pinastri MD-312]